MTVALVTGPSTLAGAVCAALEAKGSKAVTTGANGSTPPTDPLLARRSVDCYVQLPLDNGRAKLSAATAAQQAVVDNLWERLDALAKAAPLLAPRAEVLLVTGDPERPQGLSRQLAALIEVFARPILDGHAAPGVRIKLMSGRPSPGEIAAAAVRTWRVTPEKLSRLADQDPGRAFADWRDEVMAGWPE
ncbi:MAG: hypothetical protein ACRDZO_16590 [Egibacteraceae bacterium]